VGLDTDKLDNQLNNVTKGKQIAKCGAETARAPMEGLTTQETTKTQARALFTPRKQQRLKKKRRDNQNKNKNQSKLKIRINTSRPSEA